MNQPLIDALNTLLADYQLFYQRLRGYHWNVKGKMFFQLHGKFEELYLFASEKADELAERVLTIGGTPTSTMAGYLRYARLKEDESNPAAETMVQRLIQDFDFLNGDMRKIAAQASDAGDEGTLNMLSAIADEQEKMAWMLKAYLG